MSADNTVLIHGEWQVGPKAVVLFLLGMLSYAFGIGYWVAGIEKRLTQTEGDVKALQIMEEQDRTFQRDIAGRLGKIETGIEFLVRAQAERK